MARTHLTDLYLSRLPVVPNSKNQLATKMAEHDTALDALELDHGVTALDSDPRFGDGYAADVGRTVRRVSGGLRQRFEKWGTGDNDWRIISRPSLLTAQTAGDVQDVIRAGILGAEYQADEEEELDPEMAALPDHIWAVRPAATIPATDIAADITDLVGTAHLQTPNGHARRSHLSLAGQEISARVSKNTAGWKVADAGQCNYAAGSWAQMWIVKFLAAPTVDASQWFISRGDAGAGVGTYAASLTTAGLPYLYLKDVNGKEVTVTSPDGGSVVDDAWHVFTFGVHATRRWARIILDCFGWQTGHQGSDELDDGSVFGSVANDAAIFGIHDGRYNIVGPTALIAGGWSWSGVNAENVLQNSTALSDGMTGVLAI